MPQATATIGVVGLAVMGSNLARNLASREGNTVAVYNRTTAKTDELIAEMLRQKKEAGVQIENLDESAFDEIETEAGEDNAAAKE